MTSRQEAIQQYKQKLMQHREVEQLVKKARLEIKTLNLDFDKSENDIKALQSVGQIIGIFMAN